MGVVEACDGCGAVGGELKKAGIINPLDYCSECFDVAEEFVTARNELHDEVAAHWSAGMDALKETVQDRRPGMRLPDG